MNKSQFAIITIAAAALCAGIGCGSGESSADGGTDGTTVATASAVMDILNSNCMPCHGGSEPQEALSLDSIDGLLRGSEHGAMVTPGDAAGSQIINNLRGQDDAVRMPYLRDPLPESDIKLIEDWIDAGASTS